jgi:PAS domain S-box-containing protein
MQNEINHGMPQFSDLVIQSLADYAVFTTDKEGYITTWNNGAEQVLLYKRAEILGESVEVLYTPEDRALLVTSIELGTALREGRAIDERFHLKKGGQRFWASGLVFPLFDIENQHIGFTKIMRNISESEQAEANLKEERAVAQTIVRSYSEPIVILNTNLEVINATSSFLKLFTSNKGATVIGKQLFDIITSGLNLTQLRSAIDMTRKEHAFRSSFDVEFNHPDTGLRSLKVKPRRLYQPPNLLFSLEFEDGTNKKTTDDNKDIFISVASHEIKTPISVIKAYVQILQKELKDPSPIVKKAISKVNEQISNMSTLIAALLDSTRITTGKLVLNEEAINLCSLVNDIVTVFDITQSTHTIIMEKEDNGIVYADRVQIGSVITNLLSNAVKYSPDADRVMVNIEAQEHHIKVSVQDFGLGIPENEQSQIFHRFGRTGSIMKTNIPGHGLGLHLSKEIIELHGGEIGFNSAPGSGSVFYFTLPAF